MTTTSRDLLVKGAEERATAIKKYIVDHPECDTGYYTNAFQNNSIDQVKVYNPDSLELNGKFLKKVTSEIEEKLVSRPGYNNQHSILEIGKEIFENIVGSKNDTQYFLVQVGDFGSNHILNKGFYQHEGWQTTKRDSAHGKVRPGDLLLVYFTSTALDYKKTLKMIYRVKSVSKENVRLFIELWKKLKGLTLEQIRNAVKENQLSDIFRKVSQQGFNIGELTKTDLDSVLRLDGSMINVVVNEERFQEAHKMFEKEMFLKSNGIEFVNFNHPYLLKNEINYKKQIVEKTKHLRIIENLNQWIKNEGSLLEKLREVCSQSVSKNLLMGANYGVERSSASSLELVPKHLVSEYEKILFAFLTSASKSQSEFGEEFDILIEFLQTNNLNPGWRFLAYLSFIANPDKYFPIQPTLFEMLLQFYGNHYKLRANFSWKLYSVILELAEILKTKLVRYGKLDPIQIQSYIWVVSKLIENIPPLLTESEGLSRLNEIPSEFSEYENVLQRKNQVIFYGPPGTGKTYYAKKFSKYFIRYNSSNPDITFRTAAIKILKEEGKPLHYQEITKRALDRNLIQTAGETPEFTLLKEMSKDIQRNGNMSIFKKTEKGIYTLNSEILDDTNLKIAEQADEEKTEFIRTVTFHPSYSYEDFVEGIRPRQNDTQITYDIEPGIFRIICEDAKTDPQNRYVLLIDEINRGNISKIFGELITLIENDKRGNHSLHLTYSKEQFTIPKNLFIIGTMNTADRSLTQLDVALRRRFGFIELMPDYDVIQSNVDGISLATLLKNLNAKIRQHEGREKQIGHSYFMINQKPIQTIQELQFVFENEIIPLLQDYFYEDYEKLQEVLGNGFVDAKNMEIKQGWKTDRDTFVTALKPFITNE